jgi:hypothetical protein
MEERQKKTTIRMPEMLHRAVKTKAAERGITIEKVANELFSLWLHKGPGKAHVEFRPDGDIIFLTREEIEEELQKMKSPRTTQSQGAQKKTH